MPQLKTIEEAREILQSAINEKFASAIRVTTQFKRDVEAAGTPRELEDVLFQIAKKKSSPGFQSFILDKLGVPKPRGIVGLFAPAHTFEKYNSRLHEAISKNFDASKDIVIQTLNDIDYMEANEKIQKIVSYNDIADIIELMPNDFIDAAIKIANETISPVEIVADAYAMVNYGEAQGVKRQQAFGLSLRKIRSLDLEMQDLCNLDMSALASVRP